MASATTFVVDRSAESAACETANPVCKSIFAANAAVADGDTVEIKPHDKPYIEQPIVVTKRNVTFTAASGTGRVTVTGENFNADVFQLGDGGRASGPGRRGDWTVLRNLTIVGHRDGGSPVFVMAQNTLVENSALFRVEFSEYDVPVYDVSDDVVGTNTIKRSIIGQAPRDTPDNTSPAVLGGRHSTLIIEDSFIAAGYGGSAVELVGNDFTESPDPDGGDPDLFPIDNRITRSVLAVAGPRANALEVRSPWDSPVDKGLVIDNSILSGGQNGAGLLARTQDAPKGGGSVGSIPPSSGPTSNAGDIFIELTHTTIAGADNGMVLNAAAGGSSSVLSGVTPGAPGNIFVDADRSILHGGTLVYNNKGSSVPAVGGSVANTVILRIFDSDTWAQPRGSGAGGEASILTVGTTNTPDSELFADPAKRDYHLRPTAPVIDKAPGSPKANEGDIDIDGDARAIGAGADWGADEFVNKAPTAVLTADTTSPKANAPVTFDGSKSQDPEAAAGGTIKEYRWTFGDGATQTTTTPTVQHRYPKVGSYTATLVVVDSNGAPSAPATLQMAAVDGTGPTVTITSPKAGQRLAVKAVKVKSKRAKAARTQLRSQLIRFAGLASDDSGLASVQIALRRVGPGGRAVRAGTEAPKANTTKSKSKAKTKAPTKAKQAAVTAPTKKAAQCTFFDGKTKFLRKSCKKPTFFSVPRRGNNWAFRIKPNVFLRTGTYVVMVRGIDKQGNIGKTVTRRFTVR